MTTFARGSAELLEQVVICERDLPRSALDSSKEHGVVALDIETTGLKWKQDRIATCQVFIPERLVYLVRKTDSSCRVIKSILADESILKVFHHAPFDMRFMAYHWRAEIRSVACTKIASKILRPRSTRHSLEELLSRYLRTTVTKELRTSDWELDDLSPEQVCYAARDVIYLPRLLRRLRSELNSKGRWNLASAAFEYLPTRVRLDVLGCGDVYEY